MSKGNPQLQIRVPEEQLDRWQGAAAAAGQDLGEWARERLDLAAAMAGPVSSAGPKPKRKTAK